MKVIDTELLNSVELQSMEHLAAVRVAILVCESEDVQNMIGSFSKIIGNAAVGFSEDQWKRLCCLVRNKLDQIGVPEIIIDIILEKMWPISFEIFKWILRHDADMGIESSSKFCWTPHINIDYEKTAKILTENETLDIKKRFKLACFYCLKVEARSLWEMMSLSVKRCFFVRGNLKKSDLNPIVLYWAYYIQEVPIDYWESKTLNNTQLFKYAVDNGYPYATKFFLGEIKQQLRNRMISNSINMSLCRLCKPDSIEKRSHFAVVYFLVSEWSPQYPGILYFPLCIFRYFLEWPLQKHFLTVFDQLRRDIREYIFGQLLEAVFEKDLGGFKDYDYKKLFMEFWLQSSGRYKTYVNTDSRVGSTMFLKFVEKHFGFVFDENSFPLKAKFRATVLQRERSENSSDFENENVDFFKFFIRKHVTSESAIRKFNDHRLPLGELTGLMDCILGIV